MVRYFDLAIPAARRTHQAESRTARKPAGAAALSKSSREALFGEFLEWQAREALFEAFPELRGSQPATDAGTEPSAISAATKCHLIGVA